MSTERLTVYQSRSTAAVEVLIGSDVDRVADEKVYFSIMGPVATPSDRREFGERFDSFLEMYHLSRRSVANLHEVLYLISPQLALN